MANPRYAEQGKFRGSIPRKGTQDAPDAALVVVVVSILRSPPFAQELVQRQKTLQLMMGMAGHELNKDSLFPRNTDDALWTQLHAAGDGPRQPEEAATGPTTKRSPAESRGNEEQPQNPITLHALKSVNAADMQTKSARGEQLEEIQKAEGVLVQQQKDQILEQKRELALLQQQLAKQQQAQQQQQPGAAESAAAASPAAATPAAATPAAPSPSPAAADHQGEQQAEKSRKDPATAAAAAATPQPAALNTTATTEAMAAATAIVPPAEPELTAAQLEQIEHSKKKALLLRAQLEENKRKSAAQLAEEKKHQPSSSASTGQGEDSQALAPAAAAVDSASNSSGSARPEEDAVKAPAMNID